MANACNTKKNLGRTVSESYSDAMDKVKGGVSYPPNLADAKEETPNGTNGILCRTMDERRNAALVVAAFMRKN